MDTLNAVIGLITALVGLIASMLTIRAVRRSHASTMAVAGPTGSPGGTGGTAQRPSDPHLPPAAATGVTPAEAAPAASETSGAAAGRPARASDVELGLLDRIAADKARAVTAVVVGSLVTVGVIIAAPALEDVIGFVFVLLIVVAALVVGRLVYRWQYAYNRLRSESEWRAGRYGGSAAPATAQLSAEIAADAASTTFSLVAALVPSLLLGWALSGLLVLVGDIGLPGVILLLIAPYPAVVGLVWSWRRRRVLPRYLDAVRA